MRLDHGIHFSLLTSHGLAKLPLLRLTCLFSLSVDLVRREFESCFHRADMS